MVFHIYRYAKIKDDDNWLIIDENTADIKLNKLPDRESKYLINGTYYAEIICISKGELRKDDGIILQWADMVHNKFNIILSFDWLSETSKTATGTIAIQVEDFNDHCPQLTTTAHTMCLEDNVIYATAVDEDEFPNSAPFEFTVIQGSSKGKWTVEHINGKITISCTARQISSKSWLNFSQSGLQSLH